MREIDAAPDDDTESIAVECGFPQEGLDSETIEDTAERARLLSIISSRALGIGACQEFIADRV